MSQTAAGGRAFLEGVHWLQQWEPADVVLFSGESAFTSMFSQAATLSLGTLSCLLVFKGFAWALSMGGFRGGPTFPALFIGAVGGLLAAHLPGFSEVPAVAALMGAMCVSILRLPLSSVVLAMMLTSSAGIAVSPIIIVAVVVAYITIECVSPARSASLASAPTPPRERGQDKDKDKDKDDLLPTCWCGSPARGEPVPMGADQHERHRN